MNSSPGSLPAWLDSLRREEINQRIEEDPRSESGESFGVDSDVVFHDVCRGGQADFDEPWNDLSPDDRVLLYARHFQHGHLQELLTAFRNLFRDGHPDAPVVVDLGCGPCTGGLALAAALDGEIQFDYIGVDHSAAMRRLGERLAGAVGRFRPEAAVVHHWVADAKDVQWQRAPSWCPVIVIVSYLLASPTIDVSALLADLDQLLERIGRGSVTILYTNSVRPGPNRLYSEFRDALTQRGFDERVSDQAVLAARRQSGQPYERPIRYALFFRPKRQVLELD